MDNGGLSLIFFMNSLFAPTTKGAWNQETTAKAGIFPQAVGTKGGWGLLLAFIGQGGWRPTLSPAQTGSSLGSSTTQGRSPEGPDQYAWSLPYAGPLSVPKYPKLLLTSGLWQFCSFCLDRSSPSLHMAASFSSFRAQPKCPILRKAFPDPLMYIKIQIHFLLNPHRYL